MGTWPEDSWLGAKYQRIFERPDVVRKYRLLNNIAPWGICPYYYAYEEILKRRLNQTFSYEPFETNLIKPIRLLNVQPGHDEELITCSITHHSLNDEPQYWAVLLSWISDGEIESIDDGVHKIVVQKSVHQMLRRLRSTEHILTLWIDAICIYQSDDGEKSSQIAVMDMVYRAAQGVVIWVGEDNDETTKVATLFKMLEELGEGSNTKDNSRRPRYGGQLPEDGRVTEDGFPWHLDPLRVHLRRLLQRPWFSRTWVLQEVSLAQNGNCVLRLASDNVWNTIPGLPSWVPDWSNNDRPVRMISLDISSSPVAMLAPGEADNLDISEDGRFLTLHVLALDRVYTSGVPWPGNQHIGSELFAPDQYIWDFLSRAISRLKNWYSMFWNRNGGAYARYALTAESCQACFSRTIVADSVGLPGRSSWEDVYSMSRKRLHEHRRRGSARFHSNRAKQRGPMGEYHEAVRALYYKRTFFLTNKNWMGLGPFFTLPSDQIVLVPGAPLPFIMRRTLMGKYKLIGECYIHGLTELDETIRGMKLRQITLE